MPVGTYSLEVLEHLVMAFSAEYCSDFMLDEVLATLHLLTPEDHGIGVPVLGDDGQRARLCGRGTAGLGSCGTAGNRPIAVTT